MASGQFWLYLPTSLDPQWIEQVKVAPFDIADIPRRRIRRTSPGKPRRALFSLKQVGDWEFNQSGFSQTIWCVRADPDIVFGGL
jgi:hypothetical protein